MGTKICQLYQYNEENYLKKEENPSFFTEYFVNEVKNPLNKKHTFWLNFHSLDDHNSIDKLCQSLKLDKLTFDELYGEYKRPKIEEYQEYIYFSVKSALIDKKTSNKLEMDRISFVLSKNYLISFQQKSSDHFPEVRDSIEKKRGKIRMKGPDFLLFRMLEAITDNYFEVLETISDNIEKIESKILINPKSDLLRKIEYEKRKLIELRKVLLPLKDIVFQLDKTESVYLKKENHYYFSDLKDNCLTVLEEIDANKQILEILANLYFAAQGQKMNEIMKLLTIISTIFIPLTFIVGVYGMNFDYMPELRWKYGYLLVITIMSVISLLLIWYFNRRGWLKKL
ncbi:MAG: magnesium/cobalt transporter CorA [Flavobacteriia bacterium]|nr:magnesium/cobalt transporter CorA [Flavobacteriia bacterium]